MQAKVPFEKNLLLKNQKYPRQKLLLLTTVLQNKHQTEGCIMILKGNAIGKIMMTGNIISTIKACMPTRPLSRINFICKVLPFLLN